MSRSPNFINYFTSQNFIHVPTFLGSSIIHASSKFHKISNFSFINFPKKRPKHFTPYALCTTLFLVVPGSGLVLSQVLANLLQDQKLKTRCASTLFHRARTQIGLHNQTPLETSIVELELELELELEIFLKTLEVMFRNSMYTELHPSFNHFKKINRS
jgi:hypothetical protein